MLKLFYQQYLFHPYEHRSHLVCTSFVPPELAQFMFPLKGVKSLERKFSSVSGVILILWLRSNFFRVNLSLPLSQLIGCGSFESEIVNGSFLLFLSVLQNLERSLDETLEVGNVLCSFC